MKERKPRILVVDDKLGFLYAMQRFLEGNGFVVFTAISMEKALEISICNWLDLAMIDIRLIERPLNKDKTGFDVALRMDPSLTKMFITAYEEFDLAVEAHSTKMKRAGVVAVIPKSSPQAILESIHEALSFTNAELDIRWGKYSARMLIEMLKSYRNRGDDEKRAAEEELDALFCRMFNKNSAVDIVETKAGKGGCAIVRVRPEEKHGKGADVIVKFGPREKIEQEFDNYTEFVHRYAPRDAKLVEGEPPKTLHFGAIEYSFIGGSGVFGDFAWYYRNSSLEQVINTINDLFKQNCGQWYLISRPPNDGERQPLDSLYREQLNLSDETHIVELERTFNGLLTQKHNSLARHFHLEGKDHISVTLATTSHLLPNPLRLSLHRIQGGESFFPHPSLVGITHGDMNAGNILVSNDGKPFLIDFYKTGIGHIFRDFAELESVIKFELLQTDSLVARYVLERALLAPGNLRDLISLDDLAEEDELNKAVSVINNLRRLAAEMTNSTTPADMREYQVALLFYALKEIVGFSSSSDQKDYCRAQQYHALLSAALICDKLFAHAPGKEGSVFLAHEYHSPWKERMYVGLKSFLESLTYQVHHPLDDPNAGQLWLRVKGFIEKSDCGFYEITTKNGNVYFEMGYALGLRKPYFALLDKTQPNLPDIASLLRGDLILSYETEDHLQQEVKRVLELRKKWEDWFFFNKTGFAQRVKATQADAVLLLVCETDQRQGAVAPLLLSALKEKDRWQIGLVVLRKEVEIEDVYLKASAADLVVGCFSSDESESAKYANAELALALGIAQGIKDAFDPNKAVIILQEEGSEVLTDLKSLTKSFQGAEGAVEALNEELEKWLRGRLKGDAS